MRRTRVIASVGALALLVAACGGASTGATSPGVPSPIGSMGTAVTPAATASPTPIAATPSATAIAIAPGERWVLYGRHLTPTEKGLYLIRPDATGDHRIDGELGGSIGAFAWSPDGSRIAFVWTGPGSAKDGEIWTAAADGSGAAKLLDGAPDCSGAFHPGWSPDGRQLAFVCYTADGDGRLSTWDFATRTRRDLYRYVWPEHLDNGIRWSPDGRTLAFGILHWDPSNTFLDGSTIDLIASTGGAVVRLTKPSGYFAAPSWRPDGKALLVNDYDLGNMPMADHPSNLYELGLDGRVLRQITTASADGTLRIAQASWDPSRTRIWATVFTPGQSVPIRPGWVDPATGAWTALPVEGGSPVMRPTAPPG